VTDFKGENNFLFGNQLCTSNSLVHDEMLNVIKSKWF
jgi:myo-inositol-1(or 4)-monophosphatase